MKHHCASTFFFHKKRVVPWSHQTVLEQYLPDIPAASFSAVIDLDMFFLMVPLSVMEKSPVPAKITVVPYSLHFMILESSTSLSCMFVESGRKPAPSEPLHTGLW